jgi:hypothetical protein
MKKALAVVAVLAVVALVSAPAMDAKSNIGVRYQWIGPDGVLEIVNALGMPYDATLPNGEVVSWGLVTDTYYVVPVSNIGPDRSGLMLTVRVGASEFQIADPDWNWD